jgi:hypothetical protein
MIENSFFSISVSGTTYLCLTPPGVLTKSTSGNASLRFKLKAPTTHASILFDITFLKFIKSLASTFSLLFSSSSHFLSSVRFLYASPMMIKSPSNDIDVERFYTPFGRGC